MDELVRDLDRYGIVREEVLAKTLYLLGTSSTPYPSAEPAERLRSIRSGAGKSHVASEVIELFPPERRVEATELTVQSLYYFPQGHLRRKIVFRAERSHRASGNSKVAMDVSVSLREMISNKRIRKAFPRMTANGWVTEVVNQDGPIAYVETTTQAEINPEDASRFLLLRADESEAQNVLVMDRQAAAVASQTADRDEVEFIKLKHQTIQRLLQSLEVEIPFSRHITLPQTSSLAVRRAFPQLLSMLSAKVLLAQFQRARGLNGKLLAEFEDYEVAYELMLPVLSRHFAPAEDRAMALYRAIRAHRSREAGNLSDTFTLNELTRWHGLSTTSVVKRAKTLVAAEPIVKVGGSQGVVCQYRLNEANLVGPDSTNVLVTPNELRRRMAAETSQGATALGPSPTTES